MQIHIMVSNVGGIPELTGTWAIEEVAIDFAAWCNTSFRIWIAQQIRTLMTEGTVAIVKPRIPGIGCSNCRVPQEFLLIPTPISATYLSSAKPRKRFIAFLPILGIRCGILNQETPRGFDTYSVSQTVNHQQRDRTIMNPIYTAECLNGKLISELKAIVRAIGATVEGDLRRKVSWVEAIIAHQAPIEAVASVTEEIQQRNFIAEEDAIIEKINILSDALNFAILSEFYSAECPGIRKLEDDVDTLNFQLQQITDAHREYIQSLCADIEPIVDIWWQSDNGGAVSIDGGNTYRCFRVVDMLSDLPVVKLIASKKNEIDSRWATTKNNRYMRAVLEAIPAHIKQVANEIWEDGEVIGYDEDQPPGRGDGRGGRIEAEIWDEF